MASTRAIAEIAFVPVTSSVMSLARQANVTGVPVCPRCSAPTLLTQLEPHPTDAAADILTFACVCGSETSRILTPR
jgi:hypothetical protein